MDDKLEGERVAKLTRELETAKLVLDADAEVDLDGEAEAEAEVDATGDGEGSVVKVTRMVETARLVVVDRGGAVKRLTFLSFRAYDFSSQF